MIAANLYADLRTRGVTLSTAERNKLKVRAPLGTVTPNLLSAMQRHREDLLQFVYELAECAAILEVDQGNTAEEADRLAHQCVPYGTASPDGELWLRDYALHDPRVLALHKAFQTVGGIVIINVERVRRPRSNTADSTIAVADQAVLARSGGHDP